MDIIQQLLSSVLPKKVKCAGLDDDVEEEPPMEHELQAPHLAFSSTKVPSYQHLIIPIRSITSHSQHIKGFRFEINIPLSQYFQLSNTWNIPNSSTAVSKNPMKPPAHPTYTFSASVVKDVEKGQPGTIMNARMDNEGRLDAMFIKKITQKVTVRLDGMFMNSNVEYGILSADINFEGKHSNMGAKYAHSMFNVYHMQRVIKNLLLGFDYTFLTQQNLSFFGYAAKFSFGKRHLYFQHMASQGMTTLAYSMPIKKGITFVSSFSHEKKDNKTTAILGLRQRYSNSQILATINSRGKIATSLSILGGQTSPFSLKLCSVVDYLKDTYKFGYGITLGQPQ